MYKRQAFAYFEPEFMALEAEKLVSFKEQEPDLGLYDHYFERLLANKDHVLSQEAEELLAAEMCIRDRFIVVENMKSQFYSLSYGDGEPFVSLKESWKKTYEKRPNGFVINVYDMDVNISSWRVFERLDSSEADDLHLGYENAYKFVLEYRFDWRTESDYLSWRW